MLMLDSFKKSIDLLKQIRKSKHFFIGLIFVYSSVFLVSFLATIYKTTSPLLYKDEKTLITVNQLIDKSLNDYDETIDNIYWGKISYGKFIKISGAKKDNKIADDFQGYVVISQKYLDPDQKQSQTKTQFFTLIKYKKTPNKSNPDLIIKHSFKYDYYDFLKFNKGTRLENALLFPTRIKIIYHEILFSITKTFNY